MGAFGKGALAAHPLHPGPGAQLQTQATSGGASAVRPEAGGAPSAEFGAADKALNQAYQAARSRLTDQQKASLRDEQRSWIKLRDETCSEARIQRDAKGGGPMGSAMQAAVLACKAKVTSERSKQLEVVGR